MWALRSTSAPSSSPHFLPTSPAARFKFIRCAGSAVTRTRIYLSYASTPTDFRPKAPTRGFYPNPGIDSVIDQARRQTDESVRKRLYAEVQQVLAEDVPYIDLWYFDNVLVHTRRVRNVTLNPSGNYDFLKTAVIGSQ